MRPTSRVRTVATCCASVVRASDDAAAFGIRHRSHITGNQADSQKVDWTVSVAAAVDGKYVRRGWQDGGFGD
jgi:hypothetical protein